MSVPFARIGTRGSPLAVWQAGQFRERLAAAAGVAADDIEIVVIRTTGDRIQDRALSEAGGKGLFTREIDEAMLAGSIDVAAHSAKDLPTAMPDGIVLAACLERGDVRDAFVAPKYARLADLPQGARVGTASLRRGALLLRLRPDLVIGTLRGNVGTRLRKIDAGDFDATLLAFAGLQRLGIAEHATEIFSAEEFPPALGQGTLAATARTGDAVFGELLDRINDGPTLQALECERGFLRELEGSCRTPIAGLATIDHAQLSFSGLVLSPDGRFEDSIATAGTASEAEELGAEAGRTLRGRLPPDFLASLG